MFIKIYEYCCINLCKCFQHEEAKGLYYLLYVLHEHFKLCCYVVLLFVLNFLYIIQTCHAFIAQSLYCVHMCELLHAHFAYSTSNRRVLAKMLIKSM